MCTMHYTAHRAVCTDCSLTRHTCTGFCAGGDRLQGCQQPITEKGQNLSLKKPNFGFYYKNFRKKRSNTK